MVSDAALRNDARCPGALHAVAARDGLLVRVRMPGGLLGAGALAALADASESCADGNLDCTARAGIQLRGVRANRLAALAEALAVAGLLPSPAHDRVRNIAASPFAGVDPHELIDPRPLVRALDAALIADPALAQLPAKFAFAIDGGGRPFASGRADIALRAVATGDGVRMRVEIGGELAELVKPADACARLISGARQALAAARERGAAETWRITGTGSAQQQTAAPRIETPLGIIAARDPAQVTLVPVVALGRLGAQQARAVAAFAREIGADVRLAWWRGLALTRLPRAKSAAACEALARIGLPCDNRDGFAGIAACAGIDGCASALADVRGLAANIAAALAGNDTTGWNATIAGCEKRCAMRGNAAIAFVATDGGYDVTDARSDRTESFATARQVSAAAALQLGVASAVRGSAAARSREVAQTNLGYERDPAAIYRASFAMIRAEADLGDASPTLARTIVRMIHACGMTDLPHDIATSADAAEHGARALRAGGAILCDSAMLAAGVTLARLPAANDVICTLRDDGVAALAHELHTTRSAAALELWRDRLAGSVVAIGNAPTALFHLLEMIAAGARLPALVIGVPVGFVGAAESKAALAQNRLGIPFITLHGRRGGSAIASAAVNALASEIE